MIADTQHTTLYEGWQEGGYGGGSTNHAWSGGMLTDICEQILGIRPSAPGWKEVMIRPTVSPITEAAITIPTVAGPLSYDFKDDGSVYRATVTIPQGMTVRFCTPTGEQILRGGTHNVAFGYK